MQRIKILGFSEVFSSLKSILKVYLSCLKLSLYDISLLSNLAKSVINTSHLLLCNPNVPDILSESHGLFTMP